MKTKLLNEFKMFVTLQNHMEKNQQLWGSVKELGNALKKFNSNILEMKDLKLGSEIDLDGLMANKDQRRLALINEGNPVINILKVYAKESKDKSLLKKINSSKKKYTDLKDTRLLQYFKLILKESQKLYNKALSGGEKLKSNVQEYSSILNYGLSGKMIDNIEEENQNFENSFLAYSESKLQKNKDIINFELLCKKNKQILKNKIDLLVSIYKTSEPDFYNKYKTARYIEKKEKVKKAKPPVKEEVKSIENKKANSNLIENKVNKEIAPVVEVKKSVPAKKTPNVSSSKPKLQTATKGTKITRARPKPKTSAVVKKTAVIKPTQQVSGTAKTEN